MSEREVAALLSLLLECERAGAMLLAAYCEELPLRSRLYERLRAVQRDEARNCSILIHHILRLGERPSMATGEFYAKGLRVRGWQARLAFLNRGQAWVARRIGRSLPDIEEEVLRQALSEMLDSHLSNIALCDGNAAKREDIQWAQ